MHLKKKNRARRAVILLCAIILLVGALYCASWLLERNRILERNAEYSSLYVPAEPTPIPSAAPATILPTDAPAPSPTASPSATESPLPAIQDQPLPTPDSDTLVLALPSAPPTQESFDDLLKLNPETIGFLRIEGLLSLPVVQRLNDNAFYLDHSFEQYAAKEGTLFLDGMNRLVPEDDCLIVYGHNMHNDTMFGELDRYGDQDFLSAHSVIHFDTIYENRAYVPIAAFPASMNPDSESYFDVRQITFDAMGYELFLEELKARSIVNAPATAQYGDRLLLLVTCDYTKDDGRFILALREAKE